MSRHFQDNIIFGEANSSHFFRVLLRHNGYFFGAAIFSQHLLFLEELRFWNSHFLAAIIFSEYLLFGSETSTRQSLLENRKIFKVITFRITYLFWKATFLEGLLFQKRLPSIAATFSEKPLSQNILFQKSYYFTATLFLHSNTSYTKYCRTTTF